VVPLANRILLGTSGWSYKEWVGPFYRNDEESKLRTYAEVFQTAEIDSTFYAYPKRGMAMGWKMNTTPGFVFTAKLPRVITHEKKLDLSQGVEEDMRKFIDAMSPLATSDKLGCLLIQLPPSFKFDLNGLEEFFRILPKNVRFAVEFRNMSWMREETWPLLKEYQVAYTNVDEPLLPPEVHLTTDFTYFRWHGRGKGIWFDYRYGRDELKPWVPKVKDAVEKVKTAYGYFNNHYHGYAIENCLQVMEMLGISNEVQAGTEDRIMAYRENPNTSAIPRPKKGGLDFFISKGKT
jgi:uncharacterized protein YecE (DUF72 family)